MTLPLEALPVISMPLFEFPLIMLRSAAVQPRSGPRASVIGGGWKESGGEEGRRREEREMGGEGGEEILASAERFQPATRLRPSRLAR